MGDTKIVEAREESISLAEVQKGRLRKLEDNLLESSLEVVDGTCNFAELDLDDLDKVPEQWIEEMGEEAARKRHRLARAGWMPGKDAPVAISTATKIVTGIVRARATEKAGPRSLNINMVNMTAPPPQFEVVEVDSDFEE